MLQPTEPVRLHPPDKRPEAWVAEISALRQATFGGRKGNLIPIRRQASGGLVKQSLLPRQVRLCRRRGNLRSPSDLPPIIADEYKFTVGESVFGGGEQTFGGVKHTLSKYKDNFIWHTVKVFSCNSHRLSDRHTVGISADRKTGFVETVRYGAGGCASAAQ